MLEDILNFIHNYFIKETHEGEFSVTGGSLDVDFLQTGQYFRILGSVFNDGVHKNGDTNLVNEVFTGEVQSLAIPKSLVDLASEISAWCESNKDAINSPYQSESFAGYSYSKANYGNGKGQGASAWQVMFGAKLNHWRKIS